MSEKNEECNCYSQDRGAKVTIPEPERTKDNKFKCPLDQAEYDSREDYEQHCKEEHDVL